MDYGNYSFPFFFFGVRNSNFIFKFHKHYIFLLFGHSDKNFGDSYISVFK